MPKDNTTVRKGEVAAVGAENLSSANTKSLLDSSAVTSNCPVVSSEAESTLSDSAKVINKEPATEPINLAESAVSIKELGETSKESTELTAESVEASETVVFAEAVKEPENTTKELQNSDQFEIIRQLDEKERWCDRNIVITSLDHRENTELVTGILNNLIHQLPIG